MHEGAAELCLHVQAQLLNGVGAPCKEMMALPFFEIRAMEKSSFQPWAAGSVQRSLLTRTASSGFKEEWLVLRHKQCKLSDG